MRPAVEANVATGSGIRPEAGVAVGVKLGVGVDVGVKEEVGEGVGVRAPTPSFTTDEYGFNCTPSRSSEPVE